MTAMLRVEPETRDKVLEVARTLGGLSVNATVQQLLAEHFQWQCILAVDTYAQEDPDGYADYVAELDEVGRGLDEPVRD